MRESDLKWFQKNKSRLADEYKGQWIVVRDGTVVKAFPSEVEAVECAFGELRLDDASVFQAVVEDPYVYVG